MTFLEILPKIMAFLAIAWTIRQILVMREGVLSSRVMIPASLSTLLVFIVCELIVFIGGFSALHLLWMWPLSVLLGFVLLFFPLTMPVLMFFMILLSLTGKRNPEAGDGFYLEGDDIDFDENDDYFDEDENEVFEVIDVDFIEGKHPPHAKGKSEKRRKKKGRRKRPPRMP